MGTDGKGPKLKNISTKRNLISLIKEGGVMLSSAYTITMQLLLCNGQDLSIPINEIVLRELTSMPLRK